MKKLLFEEMGGTYRQEGDYRLPNLTVPQSIPVGIWGQRRKNYLRKHKEPIYTSLLLAGKLDAHLVEIDRQVEELFFQLVERMAQAEGVNEDLRRSQGCRSNGLDWADEQYPQQSDRNRFE